MKEKLTYIIAALVVYLIVGLLLSYFVYSMIDWKFVVFWAILMSVFDYLIIRNIKKWFFTKRIK